MGWKQPLGRVAAGLAVVAAVTACWRPAAVEVVGGPPQLVLEAYLDALVAGDCESAGRLAAPTFVRGNGALCGDIDVSGYRVDPRTAGDSSTETVFFVWITTPTGSPDGSIEPGEFGWFHGLQRQPDGSWKLTGGGSGP